MKIINYKDYTAALYKMKLGDEINESDLIILRVPGGWVYVFSYGEGISTQFVPYSDEFIIKDD